MKLNNTYLAIALLICGIVVIYLSPAGSYQPYLLINPLLPAYPISPVINIGSDVSDSMRIDLLSALL